MRRPHPKNQQGISLIEVVIVTFVATTLLFSISQVVTLAARASTEKKTSLRAAYYLEEGMEALRAMRNESWTSRIGGLTASTTYYFVPTANSWTISASDPGKLDSIFTRTVIAQNVYRDGNDDISSPGTLDVDTKKFTVAVSWQSQCGAHTLTLDTYLANLFRN